MTRNLLSYSDLSHIDVINNGHCQPFFDRMNKVKNVEHFTIKGLKSLASESNLIAKKGMDVPR